MTILSLHFLIAAGMWDEATQKLARKPERAKLLDGGCLPLHAACEFNAPIALIRELIAAHPDALSLTTVWGGRTPYDMALKFYNKQSPDIGDLLQLLDPSSQTRSIASVPLPQQQLPGGGPTAGPSLTQTLVGSVAQGVGRKVGQEIAGNILASGSSQGVPQAAAPGMYGYSGAAGQGLAQ